MNSEKVWTIKDILYWLTEKFNAAKIETARLDAQILLSYALGLSKIQLYTHSDKPLTTQEREKLRALVKRRLSGEPVAYITEQKDWYNLNLFVNKNVLIPRPETESLVDFIVDEIKFNQTQAETKIVFDFCTGSGCIALALGKLFPNYKIYAFDYSTEALTIARKNAELNTVTNVEFIELDLSQEESFTFIQKNIAKSANIICANPPYVSEEEWEQLQKNVKLFEPKSALISPNGGLFLGSFIYEQTLIKSLLEPSGLFCMELSHNQPIQLISKHFNNFSEKSYKIQAPHQDKPTNSWFTQSDLEGKKRFLSYIGQLN